MLIVESYPVAVLMCVITMLCWGSWANTQKLASKEWRFQLFYWDYAIGVLLLSLRPGLHPGQHGQRRARLPGRPAQADAKWLWSAFLGGVIFNLSNILLVAAIDIAGLAVAFPVGVGLALVLGVITTYLAKPEGNAPMLAARRGRRSWSPSSSTRSPTSAWPTRGQKTPLKGIVISVAAGLLMGLFYSYVAQAMGKIDPATHALEAGKLSAPTRPSWCSSAPACCSSNFLWNSIMMVKPLTGEPVPFGDYFTKGNARLHLVGILGGMIWNVGMSFSIIAAPRRGAGALLRPGPGRDDDRRALGRVHLEGVQGRAAGHQQAAGGHVPASTCSGLAS